MSTCDLGFEHEDPEPVIIEEAVDTEPVAEAEVRIAEINADRDIAVAKLASRTELQLSESEAELLRAEIAGMREALDRLMNPPAPEPEPAPVVIEEPAAPIEEEIPPREERHEPKAPQSKRGFF